MFDRFRKVLSNIPGWKTDRKIIVFESDDWGSIRTKSKLAYEELKKLGLNMDQSNFTKFDSLESNSDLERLFDVLSKHRDCNNRPATFTPMSLVANPDFEKIRNSNFREYYFETIDVTYKNYPNHNNVLNLWKQGIELGFFVPALHGREHINIRSWIDGLQNNNEVLINCFEHCTVGVMHGKNNVAPEHLGAFYPADEEELGSYAKIIEDAGKLFFELLGYYPEHFIAPNKESPQILDLNFKNIGVKYLTLSKIRKYPVGDGSHKFEINWLGKRNSNNQIVITRNCIFEPSSNLNFDWVDSCLKEIKLAFAIGKPAIINTHRVNYVGTIDEKNSEYSLKELDVLLKRIIKNWPNVEFMTSSDLGRIIEHSKNENSH